MIFSFIWVLILQNWSSLILAADLYVIKAWFETNSTTVAFESQEVSWVIRLWWRYALILLLLVACCLVMLRFLFFSCCCCYFALMLWRIIPCMAFQWIALLYIAFLADSSSFRSCFTALHCTVLQLRVIWSHALTVIVWMWRGNPGGTFCGPGGASLLNLTNRPILLKPTTPNLL